MNSERSEKSGIFNSIKTKEAKEKALLVFNEVKRFFRALGFWDYILIGLALLLGIATFNNLFGDAGQNILKKGEKFWNRVKKLGFWKTLLLIILGLIVADRFARAHKRAQVKKADELKPEEKEKGE